MRVLCVVLTGTTRAYVMPIGMVCFDLTDNRALERFQSIDDDELKLMEK